jgi:Zn-dependent protease with chaperone function
MLAAVVTLATIGAVYATAVLALSLLRTHISDSPRMLFLHGVGPTFVAVTVALGVVLPAFLRFEPPHDGERVSLLLLALACMGVSHLIQVAIRAVRMLTLSRAITAGWMSKSVPLGDSRWGIPTFAIDTGFPVVAVSGLFRPRVFVDQRVLATCSPAELDAIAAHERAHVLRRDNLRRLAIGACAGSTSIAARAWRQAAEHAADMHAADSPQRALDLASALLRVARLAPPRMLEDAALSTIDDGGSLEARIRHLVTNDWPPAHTGPPTFALLAVVPIGLVLALNWAALLRSAHLLTEAAVRNLP